MIAQCVPYVLITTEKLLADAILIPQNTKGCLRVCESMEPNAGAVGGVSNPPVAPYGNLMPQVRRGSHPNGYDASLVICADMASLCVYMHICVCVLCHEAHQCMPGVASSMLLYSVGSY